MTKHLLLLASFILTFSGCGKIEGGEEQSPETPKKVDLTGVWESPTNTHTFLIAYPSGEYSLCFSDHIIGYGTYECVGSSLKLTNKYTKKTTSLSFYEQSTGDISISGTMTSFEENSTYNISLKMKKVGNTFPPSQVGWRRRYTDLMNRKYKYFEREFEVVTDYSAIYTSYGSTTTYAALKEVYADTYFYVFKDNILYYQKKGEGDAISLCKWKWDGDYLPHFDFWLSHGNVTINY